METTDLKNKPLVEAILEVKWALTQVPPNVNVDPHYKFLIGRLSERVSEEYPEHEELPTAQLPDEISGHMVKHRFRRAKDGWPLLQVGPGILTVNDTSGYTWSDFKARSCCAMKKLFESHPKPQDFRVSSLLLRYIDAVAFDYEAESVFAFLSDKMKVRVSLPESLFEVSAVGKLPAHLNWQASFPCAAPKGMVHLRLATGQKEKARALLWETIVQSIEADLPNMPQEFDSWLDAAHVITHEWFFKLIEGELERRFRGD